MRQFWILVLVCAVCVDWTRLSGKVKSINLKDSTITVQNRDGDLLTVPVDYQVKITEKDGELRDIHRLSLDEKITLIKTPQEKPIEDNSGMAPPEKPEPTQRGF